MRLVRGLGDHTLEASCFGAACACGLRVASVWRARGGGGVAEIDAAHENASPLPPPRHSRPSYVCMCGARARTASALAPSPPTSVMQRVDVSSLSRPNGTLSANEVRAYLDRRVCGRRGTCVDPRAQ